MPNWLFKKYDPCLWLPTDAVLFTPCCAGLPGIFTILPACTGALFPALHVSCPFCWPLSLLGRVALPPQPWLFFLTIFSPSPPLSSLFNMSAALIFFPPVTQWFSNFIYQSQVESLLSHPYGVLSSKLISRSEGGSLRKFLDSVARWHHGHWLADHCWWVRFTQVTCRSARSFPVG